MRLADLNAQFRVVHDDSGPRRWLRFNCPLGHSHKISIPVEGPGAWSATGELPDTLSVMPSIDASRDLAMACGWHGFVTNGEVTNA